MPFKLYHDDRLIAAFEDPFMEPYMKDWDSKYVSGAINVDKQTLTIWIENETSMKKKGLGYFREKE